ncbi:MAG: quinol:cytochrome C oxidoreductase [Planctomycetes bacterium]|nr:quinol:cytochrome C oxidoreductase [Planctomycetota bacterium]
MTATAHMTAPSLQQLAPTIVPKVKDGDLATAQLGALVLGAALIGGAWATGGERFYFSYLVGYMGVLGICLGALFFTMVQHITRAGWGICVRRLAENIMGALPLMALLFVPIYVGFDHLFHHWVHPDPNDHLVAGKSAWLNKNFFVARIVIYFAIWIAMAFFFRRASLQQDENGDPAVSLRLSRVAAPGLLLFALSVTFAAFDWIMSLDPHWFSTIFGLTYFAGAYMAFFAFTILMAKWLGKRGYLRGAITVEHYHDLGKLMFAFVVFWTYTNFSQYMLIWYANLPEETRWFADRAEGGWGAIGTLLVFGHFFIPFGFLMSRHVKRNGVTLSIGAILLLVVHCFDMQFLILPTAGSHEQGPAEHGAGHVANAAEAVETGIARFTHDFGTYLHGVHWADFGCFVGLFFVLVGATLWNVRRANLVPLRDPRLAEALHFQNF